MADVKSQPKSEAKAEPKARTVRLKPPATAIVSVRVRGIPYDLGSGEVAEIAPEHVGDLVAAGWTRVD